MMMLNFSQGILILVSITHLSATRLQSKLRDDRIVGGQPVEPNSIPFIVNHGPNPSCGGSILNEYTVLTAAHCPNYRYVVAGDHKKSEEESTEQRIEVVKTIRHPDYMDSTNSFDFAIEKLAEPLKFDSFVQPVSFVDADFELEGHVLVYGWGQNGSLDYLDELHGVQLSIVSNEDCEKAYEDLFEVESMVCAGGGDDRDGCVGDSGGPLVFVNEDGEIVLYGVTSWGPYPCAVASEPGVWARVGAALDFIEQHL